MGVQSSMNSKVLLRLVIGVLTIISLEGWVAARNVTYGSCKPAECSDVTKGDPPQNDTKPCCRSEPSLKLELSWKRLADHYNQSLTSILEFETTGNACFAIPSLLVDLILGSPYLAFLRNCTSVPEGDHPHSGSVCPSYWTNKSHVVLMPGRPDDLGPYLSRCADLIIVPVELAREDREKMEDEHFVEKAKQGIRVEWNLTPLELCVICMEGGGQCRGEYGSFMCFCHGKQQDPHKCKRGNPFRSIQCNSDFLNSPVCFLVNFLTMLSKTW